ncbi:MAG TPA: cation transporter [Gemmatimonadales bacterium]|nr:cation transporter [Gemmatimonadales bacterium]
MERVRLEISGMSCGHCVHAVDGALRAVPGVRRAEVGLGSAVVDFDPATATPEDLSQAVIAAGYEARVTL